MLWWVIAGIMAVETAIPILWWGVRKSVSGVWYIVSYSLSGGSKETPINHQQAIELLLVKETEINRITDEIKTIKQKLMTDGHDNSS